MPQSLLRVSLSISESDTLCYGAEASFLQIAFATHYHCSAMFPLLQVHRGLQHNQRPSSLMMPPSNSLVLMLTIWCARCLRPCH